MFFHSQDITCPIVFSFLHAEFAAYVKTIGILDMSVQTAVLLFTTDQLTAIALDKFCAADAAHAILMKLENSQDHAITFKFLRVLKLFAAKDLFVANHLSGSMEMISLETVADKKINIVINLKFEFSFTILINKYYS